VIRLRVLFSLGYCGRCGRSSPFSRCSLPVSEGAVREACTQVIEPPGRSIARGPLGRDDGPCASLGGPSRFTRRRPAPGAHRSATRGRGVPLVRPGRPSKNLRRCRLPAGLVLCWSGGGVVENAGRCERARYGPRSPGGYVGANVSEGSRGRLGCSGSAPSGGGGVFMFQQPRQPRPHRMTRLRIRTSARRRTGSVFRPTRTVGR
jgi:hypothetical protein